MITKEVKDKLKQISSVYKENSKNIIIRCPYCGDSSNPHHAHLYISKEEPHPFHCFRASCESSGTLFTLLKDLNLLDDIKDIKSILPKRQSIVIKANFHKSINKKPKSLSEMNPDEIIPFEYKLDYIRHRLVTETIPDWLANKIVIDFRSISANVDLNNYVGFYSHNKHKIICRNIYNENPRYYNIQLEETNDKFLFLPNSNIDLLSSNGSVIIGEGVFDVINGYYHLHDKLQLSDNVILLANSGKGYTSSVSYIINTLALIDWKIYLLVDSDIKSRELKYSLRFYKRFKIFILRNIYGKDFGEKKLLEFSVDFV